MEHPKVSVIMSVYNAQRYLAEAVESILGQTFENFEFIIVDDGSTDRSPEILQKYALNDKRIKIINQSNAGPAAAKNRALEMAKADYIAVMDADDISIPNRLEKQIQYLEEHHECILLGSGVLLVDPNGSSLVNLNNPQTHEEIDRAFMKGLIAVAHSTVVIRKKLLLEIGGYRSKFELCEDFDVFLRLGEIGKLANLPDVLLKYRMHKKSLGHHREREHYENKKIALEEAYVRRKIKNGFPIIKGKIQTTKDLYSKWAWWALQGGNIRTARKYAFLTFLKAPFSKEVWRLLFCCLRGF